MEDKYLVCKDCGEEFLFSVSEQEFYKEKGSKMNLAGAEIAERLASSHVVTVEAVVDRDFREDRPMFKAVCAECGEETTVPFEPSGDRPIYCRGCFNNRRNRY